MDSETLVDDTDVWKFYMISGTVRCGSRPPVCGGMTRSVGIDWPGAAKRVISERDRSWPDFSFEAG